MSDNITSYPMTPSECTKPQQVDLRAKIRGYMEREGVTQKALAENIGCRPNNFCDFMKKRRGLPYDCMEKILTLL